MIAAWRGNVVRGWFFPSGNLSRAGMQEQTISTHRYSSALHHTSVIVEADSLFVVDELFNVNL
jgi:hypothetical protein